jgi:hypothetical protein
MKHVLAGARAAILGATLVACGASSTTIADLEVVTTLPKEVGPGGFEKTIGKDGVATGVFYKATLSDCGGELDKVARAWAVQNGLTEGQRELRERSARLQFASARFPEGAFLISYTLASDSNLARVHVTYGGGASAKRSFSAQDLQGLGMSALVDSLLAAARCDASR